MIRRADAVNVGPASFCDVRRPGRANRGVSARCARSWFGLHRRALQSARGCLGKNMFSRHLGNCQQAITRGTYPGFWGRERQTCHRAQAGRPVGKRSAGQPASRPADRPTGQPATGSCPRRPGRPVLRVTFDAQPGVRVLGAGQRRRKTSRPADSDSRPRHRWSNRPCLASVRNSRHSLRVRTIVASGAAELRSRTASP